jgi:hypothetical protein
LVDQTVLPSHQQKSAVLEQIVTIRKALSQELKYSITMFGKFFKKKYVYIRPEFQVQKKKASRYATFTSDSS